MKFLIISQRALPDQNFRLNNLEGHGRIDIIFRCVLSSCKDIVNQSGSIIYCFLKGNTPYGWLTLDPSYVKQDDDEISVAARIQNDWIELFSEGNLSDLIKTINAKNIVILEEKGEVISKIMNKNTLIVLGAQNDVTSEDKEILANYHSISLGKRSLLASHAIIYFRQKIMVFSNQN